MARDNLTYVYRAKPKNVSCTTSLSGVGLVLLVVAMAFFAIEKTGEGHADQAIGALVFAGLLIALVLLTFIRSRTIAVTDNAFVAWPVTFPMFKFRLPYTGVKQVKATPQRLEIIDVRGRRWFRRPATAFDDYDVLCQAVCQAVGSEKLAPSDTNKPTSP